MAQATRRVDWHATGQKIAIATVLLVAGLFMMQWITSTEINDYWQQYLSDLSSLLQVPSRTLHSPA